MFTVTLIKYWVMASLFQLKFLYSMTKEFPKRISIPEDDVASSTRLWGTEVVPDVSVLTLVMALLLVVVFDP